MFFAALERAKGTAPAQLAEELRAELSSATEEMPESFSDRVAHFIAMSSRRVLALSVVARVARAKNASEAAAEVEKLGVAKLEAIVVGQLEDLFSLQLTWIAGGSLLVCLVPQLAWLLF